MNSKYNGSMGFQRLIKEIKRDVGGGGPPGPDSVGTSQIIDASVTKNDLSTQLQDFIDNTNTALSVRNINLIIINSHNSQVDFAYDVTITDENSNSITAFRSASGLHKGSSQSILLNIASLLSTTTITIGIDTHNSQVDNYSIGSGATLLDYSDEGNTTKLTFIADGSPNIEVFFEVNNN